MGSLEERVYEMPVEVNNLISCKYSEYGCLEKVIILEKRQNHSFY